MLCFKTLISVAVFKFAVREAFLNRTDSTVGNPLCCNGMTSVNFTCHCHNENSEECRQNSTLRTDEYQSTYLSPNISVECNVISNSKENVLIRTANCTTDDGEIPMTYMHICGDLADILTDEFKEDLYRLPSKSMNQACKHMENETYMVSVVYLTEVPPGSEDHQFNLGLISSDFQNMTDAFCPVFTEIDVKLDPLTALRNASRTPSVERKNSSGNIIASFCVPLGNNCTATLSNDNVTFSIDTHSTGNFTSDNDSVTTELNDGRIYAHYIGLLEELKLKMDCEGNSSNFVHPSCDENYGMVTSTVSVKTLNRTTGEWEIPEDNKFLGVDDGKLVFRTKFFYTEGFNMFSVAPESINFKEVFSNFEDNLAESYTVLVVITCLFFLLILMTIITLGLDRRDSRKNVYHRLLDSKLPCDTSYLIALQTGLTSSLDFRSPLFIEICGGLSSSGTKLLNYSSDGMINLRRSCTTYYYMSVDTGLGPIINVRLWHDDREAGLLINKVVILDLSTRKCYLFLIDEWLSVKRGWKLYTSVKPYNIVHRESKVLFPHLVKNKVFDDLLLLSLFFRPDYNHFTRTQRLYCLSAILSLTVLTSAMWFTTDKEKASYGVSIGYLSINYKQIFTGIMSSIIALPPMLLVTLFFRNYRKRNHDRQLDLDEVKRQYRLPWEFCIIAWILVILIILISAFLIFMYSLQWGGDISEEWLISISFGFIFNIALGPLKITILSTILVGLFRRKAASDISLLPIMGLSEKPTFTGCFPSTTWPGDKDSKEERRREKEIELDQRLNKKCFELFSSVLYLTFLCLMAFHDNPNTSYHQNSQLLTNLQPDYKILKAPDIALWMSQVLHPFLSGSERMNVAYDDVYITSDGTSFIFGLVRIRQIREKDFTECINLSTYQLFSTICSISGDNEETKEFCTGWERKTENCEVGSWFSYVPNDAASSYKTYGEYNVYHGGGYVIDVNTVLSNVSAIAANIEDYSWLDYKTRFVSVEATITNPGSRLFSMISFKWEFPSIGGAAQKHKVTSFRLYPYMDPFDYLILVIQLSFIIFTLVEIVRIFYRFSNTHRGYRQILFQLLKTVLLLLSITVVVAYVIRIDRTVFTIENIFNNKEQFISFDQLVFLDELYKTCLSILIFFHILLLLKHLTYNFHIYLLQNTITLASGQMISCMVFLGIAIVAFSSLKYLFTGRKLSDYRSLYNAMLSLICAALSTAKLSSGKSDIISPFDKLTFFLFCLIVNSILLNLFICCLNETLTALKTGHFDRGSIPTFDKDLNKFVWRKFSKMFALCGFSLHDQHEAPKQRSLSPLLDLNRKISNFCSTVERVCSED